MDQISFIFKHFMFRDDVQVWTAIHAIIDACARSSARCDQSKMFSSMYKGKG